MRLLIIAFILVLTSCDKNVSLTSQMPPELTLQFLPESIQDSNTIIRRFSIKSFFLSGGLEISNIDANHEADLAKASVMIFSDTDITGNSLDRLSGVDIVYHILWDDSEAKTHGVYLSNVQQVGRFYKFNIDTVLSAQGKIKDGNTYNILFFIP